MLAAQELLTTSRALGVTVPQSHYLSTSTCLFNLFHAKIKLDVKKNPHCKSFLLHTCQKLLWTENIDRETANERPISLSLSLSNTHIHTHTHTTLCEDFLRSNPNHPDYTPQPKPPLKPSPTTPSLCEDRPKMSPLPPKNVLTLLVERASAGTNTHAHTDTHARTHLACVV